MSSDLGTSMVILTLPQCFDIRAREWPLRKLKFRCRTTRHCKTEVARKIPVERYTYRRGSFEREVVYFQRA